MIFGKKDQVPEDEEQTSVAEPRTNVLAVLLPTSSEADRLGRDALESGLTERCSPLEVKVIEQEEMDFSCLNCATAVLTIFDKVETTCAISELVSANREKTSDGYPIHIVVVRPAQLQGLGQWLERTAEMDTLSGTRIIVANSGDELLEQLQEKIEPFQQANVIKMPRSPEVDGSEDFRYFYALSPQLREVVAYVSELAENQMERIYLLGGPGSGKTCLAYHYFCARGKGRFVALNLNSESNDDKGAMKSLLCGHVSGAFPGASGREGAFSFAEDGVCFLDESHGVTGIVMQVLMEALDNKQYLPFGATKKRALNCAVVFASNRSWKTLRANIALDEHARLAATLVSIPDLSHRLEDLIAVAGVTLADFAKKSRTWTSPEGLSPEAWDCLRKCKWRGNTRTLIRVLETAAVEFARSRTDGKTIDEEHIAYGLDLWEDEAHESLKDYASYQT